MATDPKKETASDEKVPRRAWKIMLVVFVILGLILAGAYLWSNWPKNEKPSAKTIVPQKSIQEPAAHQERSAPQLNLISTGITLQPGEIIIGTKNADAPSIDLIVRFPDGEEVQINQKHWVNNRIKLTHIGNNVKGRPGEIFYRGETEKYQWKKRPSVSAIDAASNNTQAAYYPPLEEQPAPKKDCPFEKK